MRIQANAVNLQGSNSAVFLQKTPDVCPRCHRSIHPKLLFTVQFIEIDKVQAVFQCTHHACQETFIGNYKQEGKDATGHPGWILMNIAPINPEKISFPESIEKLSPGFIKIYNQAIEAEVMALDEIVGIGIRKSLEFLIKDFAVFENKDKEERIRKSQLGDCIKSYINDQNIKECAKRAIWLGNDETHYVRKWEEKDIKDLKVLVKLTVNWIENYLLTQKYISEMT